LAFLLVGAGLHTTQTAGLALTTDLVPVESQARVVGLMYVMLLLGTIVSALIFGAFLRDFSPARLIQVIQGAAVATMVFNTLALWKQETRRPVRFNTQPKVQSMSFGEAWHGHLEGGGARLRLVAIALGTLAFGMQDVLLEPYGGQVLRMGVGETTWLTATMAAGGLLGFGLASAILNRGADPARMAMMGAVAGIPAFTAVILSGTILSIPIFASGTLLIGFGAGIFSHGTLTMTMKFASKDQAGLALGAWGAVQATAAGIAVALGGLLRDLVGALAVQGWFGQALAQSAFGYAFVYFLEILLLIATVTVMRRLIDTKVVSFPRASHGENLGVATEVGVPGP
jgi:BCD family chlorophyll transporter-like MFS transporter